MMVVQPSFPVCPAMPACCLCMSGLAGHNEGFVDRLRDIGPGKVNLSLDEDTGLATLILDNLERRNGEKILMPLLTCRWVWQGD